MTSRTFLCCLLGSWIPQQTSKVDGRAGWIIIWLDHDDILKVSTKTLLATCASHQSTRMMNHSTNVFNHETAIKALDNIMLSLILRD
jgi:hypothetical protein